METYHYSALHRPYGNGPTVTYHLFCPSSTMRNSIACIVGSSISIFTKELEPDYNERNR